MSRWVDVTPDKWFYNDIEDLTNLIVDGTPYFAGIDYNMFQDGKQAIDYEFVVTQDKTIEFRIDSVVYPSDSNPIVVYVNDLIVACDEIKPNNPEGQTYIKLRRSVKSGSTVRVKYVGEPKYVIKSCAAEGTPIRSTANASGQVVRTLGFNEVVAYVGDYNNFYKVEDGYMQKDSRARLVPLGVGGSVQYPSALLLIDEGFSYLYNPYEGYSSEIVKFNGKQLRRVNSTNDFILGEEYCIAEGRIKVPYVLNNEVLDVTILQKNELGIIKSKTIRLRPTSSVIIHQNRFFPDITTSKAEFLTVLNRLRILLTKQFTDSEPWRSNKSTSRFSDVHALVNRGTPWWWVNVRDIEEMKMPDGSYLLNSREPINSFLGIELNITRAEMVELIDKFRIWFIESFK